jgi:hypothetical protein
MTMIRMIGRRHVWLLALFFAIGTVLYSSGCGLMEDERMTLDDDTVEVRIQELNSFCTVQVIGHGAVDVENDYLPSVIACENGSAPLEALKAQAIAARTYAAFITEAERRPLQPTTRDQVYKCSYRQPEAIHYQAVRETAGQVLTHNGRLAVGFYVAGAIPSASSCRATASDRDPTNTEKWVTYNQGRTGNQVIKTRLGSLSHPANRGAKSQNGASCLARNGWDYERILRFYYGDDIRLMTGPEGTCGVASGQPGVEPGGQEGFDICRLGRSPQPEPTCSSPDEQVRILPRSAWNARSPRHNSGTHRPNRISVHHTVTPNGPASDAGAMVRRIQGWHFDRNFGDIGYHFLIAWDGTIYMGRPENRIGAHVKNQNTGNLGIALLGSFHEGTDASDAQLKTLARLLRHLSGKYDIPLDRAHIKGHGERMATLCPGHRVRNRLDEVIEWAKADAICTSGEPEDPAAPGDGSDDGEPKYHYVRVTGVSQLPEGYNDTINGFEVDSIYVERANGRNIEVLYADEVVCSPNVSNPGGALGEPDNTSCEDRRQTVAGVPPGADLVVKLPEPMRTGDILFVTQHEYIAAIADCSASGTARVSVSEDGRVWKVLNREVQGNWALSLRDEHFEFDEEDELAEGNEDFDFLWPRAGHWYRPDMKFRMLVSNPAIVKVEYFAESYALGSSTDRDSNFYVEREFNRFGQRRIIARGLDGNDRVVATKEITVTITDFDGTIPGGLDDPGIGGDANINASLADRLAAEGGKCHQPRMARPGPRCTNGTGGYSTGHCWAFVKGALDRAGLAWTRLQAGPCAGAFHMSAYAFKCNADANPTMLRQIGLQRIDVPTTQAPRGAIIGWNRGCLGYHSVHGHIEISMGNGIACSDYCGRIRGNASCASVYVPVN